MKRIVTVLGCLWAVSAWAQESFVFSLADGGSPRAIYVGPGKCAETLQLQWAYVNVVTGTPNDSLQIWTTAWTPDTVCGDAPGNDDHLITSVSWPIVVSVRTGAFDLPLTSLSMFDGGSCPETSSTTATTLCASFPYFINGSIGGTHYGKGTGFIIYDADPPPAPVIRAAVGKDREVEVEFVPPWEIDFNDADAHFIALEVRAPSAADFQRVATVPVSETKLTASNLTNGIEYRVRLVAIDGAGNESAPSNEVTVTPIAPEVDAGVPDENEPKQGCTTAPGLFVALAALWLRRRVSSR